MDCVLLHVWLFPARQQIVAVVVLLLFDLCICSCDVAANDGFQFDQNPLVLYIQFKGVPYVPVQFGTLAFTVM